MFKLVHRFPTAAALLMSLASSVSGAEPEIKSITISPTSIPVPALHYRLFPMKSELNPGNAAPIYMRLMMQLVPKAIEDLQQTPDKLLAMPFDQFPKEDEGDAGKFTQVWSRRLQQMEYGAFRETCDWNHTLNEERDHVFDILLPDIQDIRKWSRAISVKARFEIKRHEYEKAIRSMETGMAFGSNVAKAPFLISSLVGISATRGILGRVEEWIGEPDSPSLYWALTAVPRPFIDIRDPLEYEYKTMEWMLPEMTDVDRKRSPAEWESTLESFHQRLLRIQEMTGQAEKPDKSQDRFADFKAAMLPIAKEYVKGRLGPDAKFTDDQSILLLYSMRYHELYDDFYKSMYLAPTEFQSSLEEAVKRLTATKSYGPLWPFPHMYANLEAGRMAELKLDTEIAALRVIEALRLHAKVAGGLPKSVDEIKVVPVPNNPLTGKPFLYELKDGIAELTPQELSPLIHAKVVYRITLRKPEK